MNRLSSFRLRSIQCASLVLTFFAVVPVGFAQNFDFSDPTLRALRQALFSGLAQVVATIPNPVGGAFRGELERDDADPNQFPRRVEYFGFGGVFSGGAETMGRRGARALTASYSRYTFDEVDGVSLRDEGVTVTIVGGVRKNRLNFSDAVDVDVFTLGGLYAVTNHLDLGFTVPILRVSVKERVKRVSLQDCTPDLSSCGDVEPRSDQLRSTEAEAAGIGDISLFGKYNFGRFDMPNAQVGFAAQLELRLPTGDTGDRSTFTSGGLQFVPNRSTRATDTVVPLGDPPLGTGIVRVKPTLITSGSWLFFGSRLELAPRLSVGAELGTTQGVTHDFVFDVGLDATIVRRDARFLKQATFSVDLLGRHAFDVDRQRVTREFGGSVQTAEADTLTASLGAKIQPFDTALLFFVNVQVPLNDTGLRDQLAPTGGLEWRF